MTVEEMQEDLQEAILILVEWPKVSVQRDPESNLTTLHLFANRKRIALIARSTGKTKWRAHRLFRGQPVSEHATHSLHDAIEHATAGLQV
jgi:hypothetical protein